MDVQRTDVARQKKRKRTILIGVALAAVLLVSFGLAQLEPAAPSVEGGALYFSNVERGEMLRQVRGPGTLVPESLQWITAATQGRIERILVHMPPNGGFRYIQQNYALAFEALGYDGDPIERRVPTELTKAKAKAKAKEGAR